MADIMRPMPAVPLESPTKLCPSSPPSPPCLVASRNREGKEQLCPLCRVTDKPAENFGQNCKIKYRTNTSEREKEKKSTLCLRGSWPSWLVGVCGRNCPIILSLPYYCAAVITLLGFQLKSNCPPLDCNRYKAQMDINHLDSGHMKP